MQPESVPTRRVAVMMRADAPGVIGEIDVGSGDRVIAALDRIVAAPGA